MYESYWQTSFLSWNENWEEGSRMGYQRVGLCWSKENFTLILQNFLLNTNENLLLSNVKEFLIFLALFLHGIYLKNSQKVQKLRSICSHLSKSTQFRQFQAALHPGSPGGNFNRGREVSCRWDVALDHLSDFCHWILECDYQSIRDRFVFWEESVSRRTSIIINYGLI